MAYPLVTVRDAIKSFNNNVSNLSKGINVSRVQIYHWRNADQPLSELYSRRIRETDEYVNAVRRGAIEDAMIELEETPANGLLGRVGSFFR